MPRTIYDRNARLVLIAMEGEKSERQYFDLFQSRDVRIVMLAASKGESSPEHVLARLNQAITEYELADEDEKWLMLDVDHWTKGGHVKNLKKVVQEARKKQFQLALSNPCFECWLLLHFQDIDASIRVTARCLESRIREHTPGHTKSCLKARYYTPDRIREAIERAERLDVAPDKPWPTQTGTRVYRTVQSILGESATA